MLHIATADLKTFYVSRDVVRALTCDLSGKVYRVELHALPGRMFYVEAENVDDAHAVVVAIVRTERALPHTGATIQRCTRLEDRAVRPSRAELVARYISARGWEAREMVKWECLPQAD